MTWPIDAYTLRARLFPALIAAAPVVALILTLTSWKDFQPTQVVATLGISVLLFGVADLARRLGKGIEPAIYAAAGGKPSTRLLRYRDPYMSIQAKRRLHDFLAPRIDRTPPTEREEVDRALDADEFYEAGGDWLRENTRDRRLFHVLFEENVTYGFRRNLLGLRPVALLANAITIAVSAGIIWYGSRVGLAYAPSTFLLVFVVAAAHAAYFLFFVTQRSVIEAANSYGRQLLLSTETLDGADV